MNWANRCCTLVVARLSSSQNIHPPDRLECHGLCPKNLVRLSQGEIASESPTDLEILNSPENGPFTLVLKGILRGYFKMGRSFCLRLGVFLTHSWSLLLTVIWLVFLTVEIWFVLLLKVANRFGVFYLRFPRSEIGIGFFTYGSPTVSQKRRTISKHTSIVSKKTHPFKITSIWGANLFEGKMQRASKDSWGRRSGPLGCSICPNRACVGALSNLY